MTSCDDGYTGELLYDEIGRVTIRCGAHLLQTAFLPVYRVAGQDLAPWAFRAVTVVTDPTGRMVNDVPVPAVAGQMVEEMHHANLAHRDGELAYVERWSGAPEDAGEALRRLVSAAAMAALPVDKLVWEIPPCETHVVERMIAEARGQGAAVCLNMNEDDLPPMLTRHSEGLPDIVRLQPGGLDGRDETPGKRAVLQMAFRQLRANGVSLLADAITDGARLEEAMDAGVDLVEGGLFGAPVLAGRCVGWCRTDARAFTADGSKVIALRR